jgi:DNA-binding XRE family transcriptional regulator
MVTESISSITPVQHIFRNHILLRNCGPAADSSPLAENIFNVNAQWRARERSFWRTNGLGAAIRKRRTILKISQEAFADLIGMHRAYYNAIERGKRNLTLGTLHRVAKGLDVRMADLMRDCNI